MRKVGLILIVLVLICGGFVLAEEISEPDYSKYNMFVVYNDYQGYDGNLGGIDGANLICNIDVPILESSKPAGIYKAYISTNADYPAIKGIDLNRPIHRPYDDEIISSNLSQLENGELKNPIFWASGSIDVWTGIGTEISGGNCNDWKDNRNRDDGGGWGFYGEAIYTNNDWAEGSWTQCNKKKGIYCIGPFKDYKLPAYCGDGDTNKSLGETCDDGWETNTDVACVPGYETNCSYCTTSCINTTVQFTQREGDGICQEDYENCLNSSDCGVCPLGNKYYMFVTEGRWNGNLGGVLGANDKCNFDDNKPSSGGTYKAFISADNGYPVIEGMHTILPIISVHTKEKIADNYEDLTNGIIYKPIIDNPIYPILSSTRTWTSGFVNSGSGVCDGWTSSSSEFNGRYGYPNMISSGDWWQFGLSRCNRELSLYCIGPFDTVEINLVINTPLEIVSSRNLNIDITTDSDVDYCTYEVGDLDGDLDFIDGRNFIKNVNLEEDGNYTLYVSCHIAAEPKRIIENIKEFYVDSIGLSLISSYPEGIFYYRNVSINSTFDDFINEYYLGINGVDYTSSTNLLDDSTTISLTKIFSDGFYTVVTRVKDLAGNLLELNFSFEVDSLGTIEGYIIDKDGNLMRGVNVIVKKSGEQVDSLISSNGHYDFSLVDGEYTISILKTGYLDYFFDILVDGKTDIEKNITMYQPDIAVDNLEISNNLIEGQTLLINAVLSNKVGNNINEITYELYSNNKLKETKTTNLSAHSNEIINFDLIAELGSQIIKIEISIPEEEINLDNNFVEEEVLVEPFNVEVGDIIIHKDSKPINRIANGNWFTVSFSAKNLGSHPINVPAKFKIIKSLDCTEFFSLSGSTNSKDVSIESGETVVINWLVKASTPNGLGNYFLSASLDDRVNTPGQKVLTILFGEDDEEESEPEEPVGVCEDSDGGLDYFKWGKAGGMPYMGGFYYKVDCCKDSMSKTPCVYNKVTNYLAEAICRGDEPSVVYTSCSNGCYNGKCL